MTDPIEFIGMSMAEKSAEKTKSEPKVEPKKKEPFEIIEGGPQGKMRVSFKGELSEWVWADQVEATAKKMGA